MTLAEIKSLIDLLIADNTSGEITPAKERQVMKAIADFAAASGGEVDTVDFIWDSSQTYAAFVPVIYLNQWYLSTGAGNIGNNPATSPANWQPIGVNQSVISFYEEAVYTTLVALVIKDEGLYYLNRAIVGNTPFVSVDFDQELLDDKWVILTGGAGGGISGVIIPRSYQWIYSSGPQTFTLPYTPSKIIRLFINGSEQDDETYTLAGNVITIAGGTELDEDDRIAVITVAEGGSIAPPVDGFYTSSANMIAAQADQLAGFFYYNGTNLYIYKGTTAGNLTDYILIGGGSGGGSTLDPDIEAALNAANSPSAANPFVTIEDLDGLLNLEERVISSNVTISSPTAGTITATWVDNQGDTNTVTAAPLTFIGAPASGNFRFDNVLGNPDGTVSVQTGTPNTTNPIIPTATPGSLILSTVLWNDAGVGEVVPPTIANAWSILRFSTQVAPGTQTLYAKIWEGPLSANDHFAFQLLYHGPREVTNFQGDGTGKLKVSWTCNPDLTIQAGTVQIETESNAAPGDFRLIRIAGNRAALYHRSRIFWGRIQYRVAYHSSAIALADFGGGAYAAAPTALQTFDSLPMTFDDYIPSSGAVLFDQPRKYGYNGTPVSGNITFGITGAKEVNMSKMLHSSPTIPTFTPPGGVTLHQVGTYNTAKVNEIMYICHKNDAGTVTRISYSISPNQL